MAACGDFPVAVEGCRWQKRYLTVVRDGIWTDASRTQQLSQKLQRTRNGKLEYLPRFAPVVEKYLAAHPENGTCKGSKP